MNESKLKIIVDLMDQGNIKEVQKILTKEVEKGGKKLLEDPFAQVQIQAVFANIQSYNRECSLAKQTLQEALQKYVQS